MRYPIPTSLLLLILATLAGCGQMGPLYMPDQAPTASEAPAASEASAANQEQAPAAEGEQTAP